MASPKDPDAPPKSPTTAPPNQTQNRTPTMEENKARMIASLQARNTSLEAEIAATKAKLEAVRKDLKSPEAAAQTVKTHICLLHSYNEIRDIGQGLMGMIADNRNVRVRDVHAEFGVGTGD